MLSTLRLGVPVLACVLVLTYWATSGAPTAQAQSNSFKLLPMGTATISTVAGPRGVYRYEDSENKVVCYVMGMEGLTCVKK